MFISQRTKCNSKFLNFNRQFTNPKIQPTRNSTLKCQLSVKSIMPNLFSPTHLLRIGGHHVGAIVDRLLNGGPKGSDFLKLLWRHAHLGRLCRGQQIGPHQPHRLHHLTPQPSSRNPRLIAAAKAATDAEDDNDGTRAHFEL